MTAKQYLMRAWRIDQRIERLIEDRDRLQATLTRGVGNLTGMPRGGEHDWTDTAIKVAEMTAQIDEEIGRLCVAKREVNEAIDCVEDALARSVLEMRYRSYMGWSDIAHKLYYSERYIFILHGRGLARVKEFIEFQSKHVV